MSIYEDVDAVSAADLITIRRNLLNVFRSLSQSASALQADRRDADFTLGGGFDDGRYVDLKGFSGTHRLYAVAL